MAAHAHLKNEFTANEKYHNLMRWLNYRQFFLCPIFSDFYSNFYVLFISLLCIGRAWATETSRCCVQDWYMDKQRSGDHKGLDQRRAETPLYQ